MIDSHLEPDPDVSQEVTLPERLEETPPGPELDALLAGIDRAGLGSDDLLRLAAARQRQIAHQEAQMLADLHTVARIIPKGEPLPRSVTRYQGKYPWAEVDTAFALRWTHTRAAAQHLFADEMIDRLPAVFTALDEGRIDVPKARVVADLLGCVDDTLAAALSERVLEKATEQTTAGLRARLRTLLLATCPEALARKARRRITERRVAAYPDHDSHLANLAGYDLAPHRVAAVMERLDAVAKAAKQAGDTRRMDQLRADVFMDLLTGEGIATGGNITDGILGTGTATSHDPAERDDPPWPDAEPQTGPDTQPQIPDPPPAQPGEPWPPDPPDDQHDEHRQQQREAQQRARWLADFDHLATTRPATHCVLCGHIEGQPATPAGPLPAPRRGTVELVTTLDTLLGLSQAPADLAGYGPVVADIARQVTTSMHDAVWRYSIYDPMQRLTHHGTTRRRPDAKLTAFIKARDRTCVAPGCRRPARRCDIDHTLDWTNGGETEPCNLGLLCRLHHLYKHATGCGLTQLSPGTFIWNTPTGRQYRTQSPPPLLLDTNQLAGLPTPTDTRRLL